MEDSRLSMEENLELLLKLKQAWKLCKQKHKYSPEYNLSVEYPSQYCPITFDSLLCWGATKINTTVYQPCPSMIGFGKGNASKTCTDQGWFVHPESNSTKPWTNYTNCIDHQDYHFRHGINDIYFYGYCISLITLIISLIIFLSFRSLRCTRIRIHVQLFTALALSCVLWMVWYKFVIGDPEVTTKSPFWCTALHIALQYLMISSYFWMFCEGMHLHLVLVVVFIKDKTAMRIFIAIGWILPMFIVGIYSALRSRNAGDSKFCWMEESLYIWILTIPVLISFICSIIFLINIVRVLITKLHPKSVSPAPLAIKKAVRATLILIPLFGLQHILFPFRPSKDSPLEGIYHGMQAVLISLQGLFVSCLFCFANHEVFIAILSFLSSLSPTLFKTPYRENFQHGPTTTRELVL